MGDIEMGAPDLKGLLPTMIVIFGLIGWGVIEFFLWIGSNISLTWGG